MARTTHLAGTWFPADASELAELLESWCSKAPALPHVGAILTPHAGYAYSGSIAAAVYSRLDPDAYDTVIVLAPSHRVSMPNAVSVEPANTVHTPLGPVVFDQHMHDVLMDLPGAGFHAAAHGHEHSVDIQLPMIQYFLGRHRPDLHLGALVVGQWAWDNNGGSQAVARFACAFKKMLTPRTLVIVSTDFTHYGQQFGYVPFQGDEQQRLFALDHTVFSQFASNDSARFEQIMQQTKATVCGKSPMTLLVATLPNNAEIMEIAYSTSGEQSNDWTHSVSYLGAAVRVDWTAALKEEVVRMANEPSTEPDVFSASEQVQLLTLARTALEHSVRHGMPYSLSSLSDDEQQALPVAAQELRGAFVTLHMNGALRGCIGEILPARPLSEVIVQRAHDAALRDSRFHPVQEHELSAIDLEISVLSPPWAVTSPDQIILGTHGVILQKNGRSAVFLPQVAPEQGWDTPTMLSHLAHKAGLPPDAWQHGAAFFVFTAQVFGEKEGMSGVRC